MQEHTLTVDGHRLLYATAGTPGKPLLILIHGHTCSHHVWRKTLPLLQEHYYCAALNLLGHGGSDFDSDAEAYSIEAQGRRVLALADALGYERFSLIGHSMGGQTSLMVAGKLAPARVERVVDVSGVVGAKLHKRVERLIFPMMRLVHWVPPLIWIPRLTAPRFRWAARLQFGIWFYRMDALDFEEWRVDRVQGNRRGMHYSWLYAWNAIYGCDVTPYLEHIQAPTLILFGKQDAVVPQEDAHAAHERIPNSELVLLDECGHFPMYEKTEPYLAALEDFLL